MADDGNFRRPAAAEVGQWQWHCQLPARSRIGHSKNSDGKRHRSDNEKTQRTK